MDSLLATENEAKLIALAKTDYSPDLSEAKIRVIHDSVRPGPHYRISNEIAWGLGGCQIASRFVLDSRAVRRCQKPFINKAC
jgi:hypothetical protein